MLIEHNTGFPDFSSYGYQIIDELGCNKRGGRVTYKARYLKTDHCVVIKRFSFHTTDWEGLKEIEREIAVLKGLDYRGIPKYLDTFQHEGTVCLVQEYIDAPYLITNRSYQLREVKTIAFQCLEILVYLQSRIPPIIHRDIKPENILWDEKTETAYLIDFGFARVYNNQSIAISSMALGTYGFMPPEAIANQLNLSSDLYSLGVTLICLLCGISSVRIGNYLDDDCQIDAKNLLSNVSLSEDFKDWLLMLVNRKISLRYRNAFAAIQSFQKLESRKNIVFKEMPQTINTVVDRAQQITSKVETKEILNLSIISKGIISVTTLLSLLGFPLIAVYSDSFFSLQKELQKNYLLVRDEVKIEDCEREIPKAIKVILETEQSTKGLENSLYCLNRIKFPLEQTRIKEELEHLDELKDLFSATPTILNSNVWQQIKETENSIDIQVRFLQSSIEFLSETQAEMNFKIFIYCFKIAIFIWFLMCYIYFAILYLS